MTTSPQKVLTAFVLVLCSVTLGFGAEPNLLNDGGFEQPIAGPGGLNSGYLAYGSGSTIGGAWFVIGSPFGNVTVTPGTEYSAGLGGIAIQFPSKEGSQWLDLTGDTDNGALTGVEQAFTTVPGQGYSLSFYLGTLNSTDWTPHDGSAAVNVLLNGIGFQTAINSDASGNTINWKPFSYTFTATGPSTTLGFLNGAVNGVGVNGLDDIMVVAVPEPKIGTLLVFGLGLFLVTGGRWDRATRCRRKL